MMKPDSVRLARGGEKGPAARRFPKGGILAMPAELTGISNVTHKRHGKPKKEQRRPFAETKVKNQDLKRGLEQFGLQLSEKQVEKLRDMSGDSVLVSILALSNRVATRSSGESTNAVQEKGQMNAQMKVAGARYGHTVAPDEVATKSNAKNLRNVSAQVQLSLDEKTPAPVKKPSVLSVTYERRNGGRVNKLLVDPPIQTEEKHQDEDPPLASPKRPILRRGSEAKKKAKEIYGGDHVQVLLKDAQHANEAPMSRGPVKNNKVLEKVETHILERFGSDLSALEDVMIACDDKANGVLTKDAFCQALRNDAGVRLGSRDAIALLEGLPRNSKGDVLYKAFFSRLSKQAKEILPDQTIRPVNQAQRKSLALRRTVGDKLSRHYGSPQKAYRALVGSSKPTSVKGLVAAIQAADVVPLGSLDTSRLMFEFQKAGGKSQVTFDQFCRVLIGNKQRPSTASEETSPWQYQHETKESEHEGNASAAERRVAASKIADARLIARVRDFCEKKRAWGAGMRDVFLLVDKERSGQVESKAFVQEMQQLGLALDQKEQSRLASILSGPDSSTCTYAKFAGAIAARAEEGDSFIHHFKQKRHVPQSSGEPLDLVSETQKFTKSCTVQQAMDMLRAKRTRLKDVYLGAKREGPIGVDRLQTILERTSELKIDPRELKRVLRQAEIKPDAKAITFEDFVRLVDPEQRARLTSYSYELIRKLPNKTPYEQAKARASFSGSSSVSASSPASRRVRANLQDSQLKDMLYPQRSAHKKVLGSESSSSKNIGGTKILHLKRAPPAPMPLTPSHL